MTTHYKFKTVNGVEIPFCQLTREQDYPSKYSNKKDKLKPIEDPEFPDDFCLECHQKLTEKEII